MKQKYKIKRKKRDDYINLTAQENEVLILSEKCYKNIVAFLTKVVFRPIEKCQNKKVL